MFFVWSEEQHNCPVCEGRLIKYGRRKRKVILNSGIKVTLKIQRFKCKGCNKTHHELPDILVPYKQHQLESIEKVLSTDEGQTIDVPVDDSTIRRWRAWFEEMIDHFIGCLEAIKFRIKQVVDISRFQSPNSSLQGIYNLVGNGKKWLARVVRAVANTNNWQQPSLCF